MQVDACWWCDRSQCDERRNSVQSQIWANGDGGARSQGEIGGRVGRVDIVDGTGEIRTDSMVSNGSKPAPYGHTRGTATRA